MIVGGGAAVAGLDLMDDGFGIFSFNPLLHSPNENDLNGKLSKRRPDVNRSCMIKCV